MIRKAKIKDIKAIHRLLSEYGKKGELLPRPLSELYDHLRDFSVCVDVQQDEVLGCCALQFCWEDLAEIRSLAVQPEHTNKNIGSTLTEAALSEAKSYNMKQVFTLTYRPEFFKKYGFVEIDRSELPLKIWGDCLQCVKFPDCDAIAMMKNID
ncbi:MAG: N-acetyltransferase [Thermodesulfobacteriota bacterium]|nr:N-acetyltransferase [Thermodesulfobacteriota bacterium]